MDFNHQLYKDQQCMILMMLILIILILQLAVTLHSQQQGRLFSFNSLDF
jgi:hypothetical protein